MARKHNKEHWGSKAAVRYIGSPKGGFRRGRKVKQNRDAIRDVDVVIRGPRPCGASELDTDLLYGVPLASANAEDSAGSAPGILGMETKRGFHWTREIQKGGGPVAPRPIFWASRLARVRRIHRGATRPRYQLRSPT